MLILQTHVIRIFLNLGVITLNSQLGMLFKNELPLTLPKLFFVVKFADDITNLIRLATIPIDMKKV